MATAAEKTIVIKGLYNEWIKNCLDLVEQSYGLSFQNSGVSANTLTVYFKDASSAWAMATAGYSYYASTGKATNLTLNIAPSNLNSTTYDFTNASGYSQRYAAGFDMVIAHELTHSVMEANIDYFWELPKYFVEGSANLVPGDDVGQMNDIRTLLKSGKYALESAFASSVTNPNTTYAAGYMLLRYFAKQSSSYERFNELSRHLRRKTICL